MNKKAFGGEKVVTVKMLKPYYIKTDAKYVRVILAYQYFSILINDQLYHFVPIEANEIKIDRKTKRIVNLEATFAFQKGKDIVNIKMKDLVALPDFLIQLYFIVESHYAKNNNEYNRQLKIENSLLIRHLEQLNVRRLIDNALDERDEQKFYDLVKKL